MAFQVVSYLLDFAVGLAEVVSLYLIDLGAEGTDQHIVIEEIDGSDRRMLRF